MVNISKELQPFVTQSLAERPGMPRSTLVSLVPSITELLFDLGLGERLLAVTDWCVHPNTKVKGLPKIGGTKNPRIADVADLRPDLVIANKEENRRIDIERIARREINVWVTEVRTLTEASRLVSELVESFDVDRLAITDLPELLTLLAGSPSPEKRTRVFCPIWKDPWMSPGSDTYINSILELCGGQNIFAMRNDTRYPKVSEAEIIEQNPECILLPSEPYLFDKRDAEALAKLPIPAASDKRIHLVDGTLLSWYGFRALQAKRVIGPLL